MRPSFVSANVNEGQKLRRAPASNTREQQESPIGKGHEDKRAFTKRVRRTPGSRNRETDSGQTLAGSQQLDVPLLVERKRHEAPT